MVGVTREHLLRAFDPDDLSDLSDEDLPAGLTHEPTRRFLTEVGLPLEFRSGYVFAEVPTDNSDFPTLSALYKDMGQREEWTWKLPDDADQHYPIARFEGGTVSVNGSTGVLTFIADWDEPPAPLHSSTNTFVYYLYKLEINRSIYGYESVLATAGDDPEEQDAARLAIAMALAEALHEADPTPFPDGIQLPWSNDFAGPWTAAFFDIAQGMWSS